jgi:carboxyl-terminal processing protease
MIGWQASRTRQSDWQGLVLAALVCAIVACRGTTLQAYPDQLVGIGVVIKALPEGHTVTTVVADGPAATAGIEAGDRIVAINGQPTEGKSLASVVESLRGKAGTSVQVRTVGRRGEVTTVVTRRMLARNGGSEYRTN